MMISRHRAPDSRPDVSGRCRGQCQPTPDLNENSERETIVPRLLVVWIDEADERVPRLRREWLGDRADHDIARTTYDEEWNRRRSVSLLWNAFAAPPTRRQAEWQLVYARPPKHIAEVRCS